MGTSGMALTWDLVLKPQRVSDDARSTVLTEAASLAREKQVEKVREILSRVPDDADADFLAAAARIALVARDTDLARTLFRRALERDPSSYRASMGIASLFLLQRDFDSASRAFDATRNRTNDKDEQKFLTAAIGDLAEIKVR
jgi:thioredoxin-like negative regulator of GroEL